MCRNVRHNAAFGGSAAVTRIKEDARAHRQRINRRRRRMPSELEKRVMRKIGFRIVPFIMLLYFIAFIDRVNIGFAALTMNKDLGFSPTVFGFGVAFSFSGIS